MIHHLKRKIFQKETGSVFDVSLPNLRIRNWWRKPELRRIVQSRHQNLLLKYLTIINNLVLELLSSLTKNGNQEGRGRRLR